jgi:hypothetical protein
LPCRFEPQKPLVFPTLANMVLQSIFHETQRKLRGNHAASRFHGRSNRPAGEGKIKGKEAQKPHTSTRTPAPRVDSV